VNRRGFFGVLLGAGASLSLDPERALWKPGAKLISVPKRVSMAERRFFGVQAVFPNRDLRLSLQDFERRYLEPAAAALADSIESEVIRGWRRPRFERLCRPNGVVYTRTGPMGRLPEARVTVAYDIAESQHVCRVDALVRI
jgi:hypothetical protein